MKKVKTKIMLLAILLIFTTGLIAYIVLNEKKDDDEIIFYCKGRVDYIECVHKDEQYSYCTRVGGHYIRYNEKRYYLAEALQEQIITLENLDKAIQEDSRCSYDIYYIDEEGYLQFAYIYVEGEGHIPYEEYAKRHGY